MQFKENSLEGSYLIDLEKRGDERGFFARLFCSQEFAQHGLEERFIQANDSLSTRKGTLRGMHYQLEPMAETKLVRCLSGSLYDVILDIRPDSLTFGQSFGAILSAENRRMMYVPKGFAHGFLTLDDNVEVIYFVSQVYSKELERGIRWNDPRFNIPWPMKPEVVSDRDQNHPDFTPSYHLADNL
ncbi:MAG: dTDP-4-dehydrorhamnose 3,5-epimerase [Parachlamydia sp.]|nr:dTDP-4-dehydrorhamnose 3,5-epimerase [Parachlamydia sp.]